MNKQLYGISSYIPSDDNVVEQSVYVLAELGNLEKRYVFIRMNDSGGIGTGIDNYGNPTKENAILQYIRVNGMENSDYCKNVLDYFSFEEMLQVFETQKEQLTKKLK